jgi:hypothetical protein
VIHAYAKSGGTAAAAKAQQLLTNMHKMYEEGNTLAKPDTITVSLGVLVFERVETTKPHHSLFFLSTMLSSMLGQKVEGRAQLWRRKSCWLRCTVSTKKGMLM